MLCIVIEVGLEIWIIIWIIARTITRTIIKGPDALPQQRLDPATRH